MKLERKIILTAALLGGLAVMLGAMTAHMLKGMLNDQSMESFNTGVRYQMYHALFLLALVTLSKYVHEKALRSIYNLTLIGVILFSGSIYLLNLGPIWEVNMKFLGPITPIGGLLMISSWLLLAWKIVRNK